LFAVALTQADFLFFTFDNFPREFYIVKKSNKNHEKIICHILPVPSQLQQPGPTKQVQMCTEWGFRSSPVAITFFADKQSVDGKQF
jgi:hypothetical protein